MKRFLIILALCFSTVVSAKNNFIIVIDAGSSGSRIHLFGYDDSKKSIDIDQYAAEKVAIPLSKQPSEAIQKMVDVLLGMNDIVRRHGVNAHEVPVYLNATAGMRLLEEKEQQAIYTRVMKVLPATGFDIKEARTISGEDEGKFGWLSVNYLVADHFNKKTDDTIDMGGASIQITTVEDTCDKTHALKLGKKEFCIKPVSYLGLGADQAEKNSATLACYPTGYQNAEGKVSSFDYDSCRKSVDSYLDKKHVSSVKVANDVGIDAISSVYYTVDFFKAYNIDPIDKTKVTSIKSLKKKVLAQCQNQDWEAWKQNHPKENVNFLKRYCFSGIFLERMVSSKSGFELSDVKPIKVLEKFDNKDVSWPLGAAIFYIFAK